MVEVANLSYKHPHSSVFVLQDISFCLSRGNSLLLTGRSGSGKSTLLSILSGLVPHYHKGKKSGIVQVCGFNLEDKELLEIGKDVVLMLQNPELQFFAPTVYEELYLTLKCKGIDESLCDGIISAQVDKFDIEDIKYSQVSELSEGQKQKVVLACLTALRPSLVLLDEPTANLDLESIDSLRKILLLLKSEGTSFIISDHRLSWVRGICEEAVVLENGKIAWHGLYDDIEPICKKYNLRSSKPLVAESSTSSYNFTGDKVFIKDLSFSYKDNKIFENLSFGIPFGKVTTLSGPSGIGKTTLGRILAGLMEPNAGSIFFSEEKAHKKDILANTTVILQNCDHQLYMNSVFNEVALALYSRLDKKDNSEYVLKVLKKFGLDNLSRRHPHSLSGGEKQRLAIAAGLANPPRLLVLDEPTSGMDGYNLRLMAKYIRDLANDGLAVFVITHDEELINMCSDYKLKLSKRGLI